jgi:hypothetical protein
VNCAAHLLWHLDDEVEEKSCKAELHPHQSVDRSQWVQELRLTPKKCMALSLMGNVGNGAMPRIPNRMSHAAVAKITAWSESVAASRTSSTPRRTDSELEPELDPYAQFGCSEGGPGRGKSAGTHSRDGGMPVAGRRADAGSSAAAWLAERGRATWPML